MAGSTHKGAKPGLALRRSSRIVPCEQTPPKNSKQWKAFKKAQLAHKAKKVVKSDLEENQQCSGCVDESICAGGDGFIFCYDNAVLKLVPPSTGGPWAPVMQPNGQVSWFNTGGL